MSNIAIHVDSLGKRYRIGSRERHVTMRDRLSSALTAPARWLCEQAKLSWAAEGRFLANGSLAAFDPTITEQGPSTLLVNFDWFRTFLEENAYDLVWTVLGEKLIVERGGGSAKRLLISGMYELTAAGDVSGSMTTFVKS